VFNDRVSEPSEIDALVGGVLRTFGRALLFVDSAVDRLVTGLEDLVDDIGRDRTATVLGVDGCKAGWVGVVLSGGTTSVAVAPTLAELVAAVHADHHDLAVVGIDIPIGLADTAPRQADLLARQRLPTGRKSSVFPAPTRVATAATTHVEASAAQREATGVGLSIQAFYLVPKILEVDAYVRQPRSCRIVEVHPEVSFAAMDAGSVVPAKRTPAGAESRAAALRAAGIEPPSYVRGQGYAADDLLDACAAAWTAARAARGDADTLPDPPETFSDALPAAIWV
jgi:predicted RNase H-like nuclease